MSAIEEARLLDRADRPLEAVAAYERALQHPDVGIVDHLDLAVLYIECCETGYSARHQLSQDFVAKAFDQARRVLDQAEERFDYHNEVDFWRYYSEFYLLGGAPDVARCEDLGRRGPSLVPYFHLFALPGGERYSRFAGRLLEEVKEGRTARERHIRSVLESHASAAKWRDSESE
jgi:hypothetical protein